MISLKCVCLMAKEVMGLRHWFISSWTFNVRRTHMPSAVFNMCWILPKITSASEIVGTALFRIPRRRKHFVLDTMWALGGVSSRAEGILSLHTCNRGYGLVDCFNITPNHSIHGAPIGAALCKFLQWYGILTCHTQWIVGSEQWINQMKKVVRHLPPLLWDTLYNYFEVV